MTASDGEGTPRSGAALVVHPDLPRKSADAKEGAARLAEAVGLAEAIGLRVVDARHLRVAKLQPATLFGSGHAESLGKAIAEHDVEVAIVDAALTPVQQRNLELAWRCKVLDRTALILEIFGARARTHEGRLQVELAALQYQRSRLVRSWTHLERQRGGFGFLGGPGESQLEIDRRLIDLRIAKLEREIASVRRTRTLHREARRKAAYPTVALVGYTNAGKSTLFNRLTDSRVVAKDMLFATLDPTMRSLELPSGRQIILCDTVGFISDLPTELVASFRATLEEVTEADLILHVQDSASPENREQRAVVEEILREILGDAPVRVLDIQNKIDLLPAADRAAVTGFRQGDTLYLSAWTGEGCRLLLEALDREFLSQRAVYVYDIPAENGAALAWLYAQGNVISIDSLERSNRVKVALLPPDAGRFESRFHVSHLVPA